MVLGNMVIALQMLTHCLTAKWSGGDTKHQTTIKLLKFVGALLLAHQIIYGEVQIEEFGDSFVR